MMKIHQLLRAMLALTMACACSAPEASGAVLHLTGAGADGATYRLRDGVFTVDTAMPTTLSTETDPDASVLSVDLEPGGYEVELADGWRLERVVDGQVAAVEAMLTSDNPVAFTISSGARTSVAFRFLVSGVGPVEMGPGTLDIGIEVELPQCDPVAQTGCASGEKCTFVVTSTTPVQGATQCAPDGSLAEGEACTRNDAGSDDCAAGLYCVDGACLPTCGVSAPPADCQCTQLSVFDEGIGVCTPACDPLVQDCAEGQGCYVVLSTGAKVCAPTVVTSGTEGAQGDPCEFVNGCAAGFGCALSNDPVDPTGLECAFYCDPTGSGGPHCLDGPGAGFDCVSLAELYANTVSVPADIGVCVDCAEFPCGG